MSNTEINILIAQALGWTRAKNKWGQITIQTPRGNDLWTYDNRGNSYGPIQDWNSAIKHKFIPDYVNDLNAMHEAKLALSEEQRISYIDELCRIVNRDDCGPYSAMVKSHYATASRSLFKNNW